MIRSPISKKTRFEVFKRDRFACQYCGAAEMTVERRDQGTGYAFKYFCGICWNWIRDGRDG